MLTNLELDGELSVIHARWAKVGFGGCSPLFFLVPHLFWRSSARLRTSLALGVGSYHTVSEA